MSSKNVLSGLLLSSRNNLRGINLSSASRLSTAVHFMSDRNKPRNSGDKGPERNFKKKMMKKANKSMSPDVLMRNLKVTEAGECQPDIPGVEDNLQ